MKKIKEKDDDYVYVNAETGIDIEDSYCECTTLEEAQTILSNMDIGNAFLIAGQRPYSTKYSVEIVEYNGKFFVPLYDVFGLSGKTEKKICAKSKVKSGWTEKWAEIKAAQ